MTRCFSISKYICAFFWYSFDAFMTVSQKLHQICVSIEDNVNGRLPWSTLFEQHLINTLKHTVLTDVIRVDKVLFKRVN